MRRCLKQLPELGPCEQIPAVFREIDVQLELAVFLSTRLR